ncbi:MAG: Ig-like domain-containing protein [Pseudomonadota bacterium]
MLMCASLAATLSACGGGGGSPGTVPGQPPVTPTVATVTLSTSATSMPNTGAPGSEVTLTATVKDADNNAMSGITVAFAASSGVISKGTRVTDASGTVTEKLSIGGDVTAPRDITVTATAGGKTSNTKTVNVTPTLNPVPKVVLTSTSGTLNSGGALAVQIRALVIDSNNVVVPNAVVNFSTDSGTLSAGTSATLANGTAVVDLNTGGDPSNRTITVKANTPGAVEANVKVNVIGTSITLNGATTVNKDSVSDINVVLTDSSGNPLLNRAVTFSATANPIAVKGGGASTTDSTGKLVLSYTASAVGTSTITVTALGQSATLAITTVSADFSIIPVGTGTPPQANTGACNVVNIRDFVNAVPQSTVSVTTSRGLLYTNAACTAALGSSVPLTAGLATVYVKSGSPGVATLSATDSVTHSTVQSTLEFVSPLTATSVISLQANPSVVSANSAGSTSQQVVLRAVVTDSASLGNPVKNAKVAFTILADPSGGTLSQPSEVLTGADGSATVSYIAGTTATATGGVQIRATVQSVVSSANATALLTVGQRALFITAGTGNTILTPSSTTYQVDYTVFVTDAAGNAVRDVVVTGKVRPRYYYKGFMVWSGASGPWVPNVLATCLNEDLDSDGFLGTDTFGVTEDTNTSGHLDPGIPITVTSSGKTDGSGTAVVSLLYPKDRAYWIDADFTFTGAVSGTEASYVGYTVLPGAGADYATKTIAPPGAVSPYGFAAVCTDKN